MIQRNLRNRAACLVQSVPSSHKFNQSDSVNESSFMWGTRAISISKPEIDHIIKLSVNEQ